MSVLFQEKETSKKQNRKRETNTNNMHEQNEKTHTPTEMF